MQGVRALAGRLFHCQCYHKSSILEIIKRGKASKAGTVLPRLDSKERVWEQVDGNEERACEQVDGGG